MQYVPSVIDITFRRAKSRLMMDRLVVKAADLTGFAFEQHGAFASRQLSLDIGGKLAVEHKLIVRRDRALQL